MRLLTHLERTVFNSVSSVAFLLDDADDLLVFVKFDELS